MAQSAHACTLLSSVSTVARTCTHPSCRERRVVLVVVAGIEWRPQTYLSLQAWWLVQPQAVDRTPSLRPPAARASWGPADPHGRRRQLHARSCRAATAATCEHARTPRRQPSARSVQPSAASSSSLFSGRAFSGQSWQAGQLARPGATPAR